MSLDRVEAVRAALHEAGASTSVIADAGGSYTVLLGTRNEPVWSRNRLDLTAVEHFLRTYGREMYPEVILP